MTVATLTDANDVHAENALSRRALSLVLLIVTDTSDVDDAKA